MLKIQTKLHVHPFLAQCTVDLPYDDNSEVCPIHKGEKYVVTESAHTDTEPPKLMYRVCTQLGGDSAWHQAAHFIQLSEPVPVRNRAKQIVDLLNEAMFTDPICIDAMLQFGVPCNSALRDHPTIQVRTKNKDGEYPMLTVLGLLNGIAELDHELIVANYDEDAHTLQGFSLATPSQRKQMGYS